MKPRRNEEAQAPEKGLLSHRKKKDSLREEVLCNIFIEFSAPKKIFRVIKNI
jgi:hypothetical protein